MHIARGNGSPRPLVLVVDDDRDTRELYRLFLELAGCDVQEASSVTAAAAAAEARPPDVAVTDWRLPDGTGADVCGRLRAISALVWTPIIGVTGAAMPPSTREAARALGCDPILTKPVDPDVVLDAISAALQSARIRRVRETALGLLGETQRLLRESREILEASQQERRAGGLLREFRQASGVALLLADDAAHYVAASADAEDLTGYDPDDLTTLSVWDLTPAPASAAGLALWEAFISAGQQEGRYPLVRRDGTVIEAIYFAVANIAPGLHLSALAPAVPQLSLDV